MTTTALFADAINRLDDGVASPADREAAEQHDRQLQWVQPTAPCYICGAPDGGKECAPCTARWDQWIGRNADV